MDGCSLRPKVLGSRSYTCFGLKATRLSKNGRWVKRYQKTPQTKTEPFEKHSVMNNAKGKYEKTYRSIFYHT